MLLSNLGQPLKMKLQTDAHYYKSFCVDHSTRIFVSWQKKFGSVRPPRCLRSGERMEPPACRELTKRVQAEEKPTHDEAFGIDGGNSELAPISSLSR
jgi:hypothetical protein